MNVSVRASGGGRAACRERVQKAPLSTVSIHRPHRMHAKSACDIRMHGQIRETGGGVVLAISIHLTGLDRPTAGPGVGGSRARTRMRG